LEAGREDGTSGGTPRSQFSDAARRSKIGLPRGTQQASKIGAGRGAPERGFFGMARRSGAGPPRTTGACKSGTSGGTLELQFSDMSRQSKIGLSRGVRPVSKIGAPSNFRRTVACSLPLSLVSVDFRSMRTSPGEGDAPLRQAAAAPPRTPSGPFWTLLTCPLWSVSSAREGAPASAPIVASSSLLPSVRRSGTWNGCSPGTTGGPQSVHRWCCWPRAW